MVQIFKKVLIVTISLMSLSSALVNAKVVASEFFNTDLIEIMDALVHNNTSNNNNDLLPQSFMNCYDAVHNKIAFCSINDIVQTLDYITKQLEQGMIRAPRLDAVIGDGSIVGPLLDCNFKNIIALIQKIKNSILDCCQELQEDFEGTFTVLIDIKNTLTACCSNFSISTTSLVEIFNTLTACCASITQQFIDTWTLLHEEFNGTFSALSELNDTLTTCCEDIEINFEGTFTALRSINLTCSVICFGIPITAPITITNPGLYCLANDIAGTIIIDANNVTLDLNNHTITGGAANAVVINAGSNRVVKSGRLTSAQRAIQATANTETFLKDLQIFNCSIEGITIENSDNIEIESVQMSAISGPSIHFTGTNLDVVVKKVIVDGAVQGIFFDNILKVLIDDCHVLDSGNLVDLPISQNSAFSFINGSFIQCNNCSVKDYNGLTNSAGFSVNNAMDVIFKDCVVQNIIVTSTTLASSSVGFFADTSSSNIQYVGCSALNIVAGAGIASCFELNGSIINLNYCYGTNAVTTSNLGVGFRVNPTANQIFLYDCQGTDCDLDGFRIVLNVGNTCELTSCVALYNITGFHTDPGTINNISVSYCVAFRNTTGFNNPALSSAFFRCFAGQNGTNYVGVANTQNAGTQVNNAIIGLSGPFAGGNLFLP